MSLLQRISEGRTDLVFEYVGAGNPANARDERGVSLMQHCAYYGDVSAIRFLLGKGEALKHLGDDLGLSAAGFHGHWRLCEFLIESGAGVNRADSQTGETVLHAAICKDWPECTMVVRVLLAHGADPNVATKVGVETGAFMRDVRTRGETPLHRAAAFAEEEAIDLLIKAGAKLDAKDANGDSPLSWASWHLRPDAILRKLCYGDFRIRPDRKDLKAALRGTSSS